MDDIKPMLIGGEWNTGSGATFTSQNPATGEINYQVCDASAQDVDLTVGNAQRAASEPSWRQMLPHVRGRLLSKLADVIETRADELAVAQMRENGKVLA